MSRNRRKFGLLTLVLTLSMASTATAQQVYKIGDLQLFAPRDPSDFEDKPVAPEGFFFNYDALMWTVSSPERAIFGAPGSTRLVFQGRDFILQQNSHDTSGYHDIFRKGDRMEFGYLEDDCGWLVGSFALRSKSETLTLSDADMVFDDPFGVLVGFIDVVTDPSVTIPNQVDPPGPGDGIDDDIDGDRTFGRNGRDLGTPNGTPPPAFIPPLDGELDPFPTDFDDQVPLPVRFHSVVARLETTMAGGEAMRFWRTESTQFGGWFDLMAGLRYLNFDETFMVSTYSNGPPPIVAAGGGGAQDENTIPESVDVLRNSKWNTKGENNLLGPQFGLRWANKWWFWTNAVEFRFTPAVNFQNVRQAGILGDQLIAGSVNGPTTLQPRGFNHTLHEEEFSPILELKLATSYQLTRAIALRAGYNCLYMDGIARPNTMVRYSIERMGILENENSQSVIAQGFFIGAEINR